MHVLCRMKAYKNTHQEWPNVVVPSISSEVGIFSQTKLRTGCLRYVSTIFCATGFMLTMVAQICKVQAGHVRNSTMHQPTLRYRVSLNTNFSLSEVIRPHAFVPQRRGQRDRS